MYDMFINIVNINVYQFSIVLDMLIIKDLQNQTNLQKTVVNGI